MSKITRTFSRNKDNPEKNLGAQPSGMRNAAYALLGCGCFLIFSLGFLWSRVLVFVLTDTARTGTMILGIALLAVALGACFRLAGIAVFSGAGNRAKTVAVTLALVCGDAVLSVLLTRGLLIPVLGIAKTLVVMVSLIFLYVFSLLLWRRTRFSKLPALLPACYLLVFLPLVLATPRTMFERVYASFPHGFRLLDFEEGAKNTVTAYESERPLEESKYLAVNGSTVAGTDFEYTTTETLLGHLALLLRGETTRMLQIGCGTGKAARSAFLHPLQELDLLVSSWEYLSVVNTHFSALEEIGGDRLAFYRARSGGKVPRFIAEKKYDSIISYVDGPVGRCENHYYSTKFFESCRRRLTANGFFATHLSPTLDPVLFEKILRSFQSVFPHCSLWIAPNSFETHLILLGATSPWNIDLSRINEALKNPDIAADFARVRILSEFDFLACMLLDAEGFSKITGGPENESETIIYPRSTDRNAAINVGSAVIRRAQLREIVPIPSDGNEDELLNKIDRYDAARADFYGGIVIAYQGRLFEALEKIKNGSRRIPESELTAEMFYGTDFKTGQLSLRAANAPQNLEAQLGLARHLMSLEHHDEAARIVSRLLGGYPRNAELYYEMARCNFALENYDESVKNLEKSLQLKNRSARAWYYLGRLQRGLGLYDAGFESLTKALELDPGLFEAHNELAAHYESLGDYRAAGRSYVNSLTIMEYQPEITVDLADIYIEMRNEGKAIEFYRKALHMGYRSGLVFWKLGNAYFLSENFVQAAEFLESAAALDSANADIYFNLGNAYVMQLEFENAIRAFASAVELNPDSPDNYNNLALSYRELGKFREAMKVFERGMHLFPSEESLFENAEKTKTMMREK